MIRGCDMRTAPMLSISRLLFVPSLSQLILGLLISMPMFTGAGRVAWGELAFATHVDYPAPGGPGAMVSGDFDRDGHPGLAVANYSGTVSIFLNNGDGTFRPGQDYSTGGQPRFLYPVLSIATADLNRDGILDLVVANSAPNNTVFVLLGNGDGTFQTSVGFGTGAGPGFVAIQDCNRDGRLDLAVTNSTDNTVSVLLGNGAGGFGSKTDFATGINPVSLAVGDVNGDGEQDLIVSNLGASRLPGAALPIGTVSVLLGRGDGTFLGKTDYPVGVNPSSVATADLNRDGNLDLAVADQGNYGTVNALSILLGNGDGSFRAGAYYDDVIPNPAFIAIGDLDGDGLLDLAVAMVGGVSVIVFLGNGDGTFQTRRTYLTGEGETSLAIADLDGDGMLDLAVTNVSDRTLSTLIQ